MFGNHLIVIDSDWEQLPVTNDFHSIYIYILLLLFFFKYYIKEVNCSVSNILQNIFFCAQQMKETRRRTGVTLWLCPGQIDPEKIDLFLKILVNVITSDSNLLILFTQSISTSQIIMTIIFV